ncbi:AzlD domain-containing protein [Burkholderiaceae bacterium FT117]|uniref:AzlD domain-containing protein n=1 Tax=Zeimonas sediminis TaxID=2944268 RepID=UPI002342D2EF|nr:AzlD domain-containing protein [Zeimonas sediminis]MCM5570650.1 AzlD domain-containing protein [Zeimonas sediminis]
MSAPISLPAFEIWTTILMLALVIVGLRNAFLVLPRDWLPRGTLERALRYAPLAALVALLAPELAQPILRAPGFSWAGFVDPRVLSAVVVIVVSRVTRNALAALAAGVAAFFALG